jgi:hypothetical protein
VSVFLLVVGPLLLAGCPGSGGVTSQPTQSEEAAIKTQRASLKDAVDRQLVDEQEWCAVHSDNRLGCMGPPVKVLVKGEPVFLCCASCETAAVKGGDEILAKVKELKDKAKQSPKKSP